MEDILTTGAESSTAELSSPSDFSDFISNTPEATGNEEPNVETETTDQPDGEQEQAEETTETAPEGEFDAEIGAPTIVDGPNGQKLHQYSVDQSAALQSNSRFAAELRAAIPDITVDDAVAHSQAYTDLSRLVHDMRRGTPQSVERFAKMVTSESKNGFAPQLTKALVDSVRTTAPEVYEQIRAPFEKELGEEFFGLARKVANHPDKNVRDGYRMLAQLYHYHISGGETRAVGEEAAIDPLKLREDALKAREDALAAQDRDAQDRQTKAWTSATKTEFSNALQSEIDVAIEPFKARYKDPSHLALVVKGVIALTREAISGDEDWRTRFDIEYENALDERSKESAQRVKNFYLARVRGILKNQLPKMLTSASNDAISENKSRRQQLERASSSSHRVPGATGAPARQSIMQKPTAFKSPKDYEQELDRLMTA